MPLFCLSLSAFCDFQHSRCQSKGRHSRQLNGTHYRWQPMMTTKYKIDSQECLKIPLKNTDGVTIYCFLVFSDIQLLYRATIQVYYWTPAPHFSQGPNFLADWDQLVPDPYTPLLADTLFMYFITNTVWIHGILICQEKKFCFGPKRYLLPWIFLLLGKGEKNHLKTKYTHR